MKKLILVSGPPGCGKSTLAIGLAKKLRAVYLDKDQIDEPFSPDDRGEFYTREIEPKVLDAMLRLADSNFRTGSEFVILDAPWTHILIQTPSWKKKIQKLAKKNEAELVVLECFLSDMEVLKARIKQRGLLRDQIKLTDEGWKRYMNTERPNSRIDLPHILVDLSETSQECLIRVETYFRTIS